MKTAYTRLKKELALLLVVAMVISMVGCKKKKAGTDVSVPSESETIDTTETTESEPSETTPTEPSESNPTETDPSASIVTPSLPDTSDTSVTESTEHSETTVDPTAAVTPTDKPKDTPTPTNTSTPKPTKAPKETKKADPTPSTPPTNTPTSTSTPTPVPATPTPTDTPTTAPARTKDAKDYMGTARSAVKQAITDKCGWKTGFEFNDKMMENEKARAKYSINNDYFGHGEISGTVIPLEACGGVGCTYLPDTDQLEWYWTDHAGTNHYYKDDAYGCFYDFGAFLVVEHTEKLAGDDKHVFFGYGVSIKYTPWERSYGLGTVEEWSVSVYIGADSQLMYDTHFPT